MSSSPSSETRSLIPDKGASHTQLPTMFSLKAYWELARMDKFPAGSILIFWPAAYGYLLGAHAVRPDPTQLAITLTALIVWSTILHSAGCVINDICDVEFDRQVERTKNRPLAAGKVSILGAWLFLFLQLGALIGMLTFVNSTAFYFGVFNIFPLATLYPLMKRITWWPQAWLGVAMNWSLPTAWLITSPEDYKSLPMWTLTFGAFCWTIFYDTIYACQDRKDDLKAGVKSTALLFGSYVKQILAAFAAIFVISLAYTGHALAFGFEFYVVSVGVCAVHLIWQLVSLDTDDPRDCWRKFLSNGNLGYIVVAGILADHFSY